MIIPDKVIVKGKSVQVNIEVNDHWGDAFLDHREDVREIVIRETLSEKNKIITLIHEILHFLDFDYKLKLTHAQIYDLEKPIYNFIIQNKQWLLPLVKDILEKKK